MTDQPAVPTVTIIVHTNNPTDADPLAKSLFEELPVNVSSSISFENQQVDDALTEQAVQKLFVTRPAQTGLSALAIGQMTDAANSDPENTMIVIESSDDETVKDEVERLSLERFFKEKGAKVFPSMEAFKAHVIETAPKKIG